MATELTYLTGPSEGQNIVLDSKKPELILGRAPDVDIRIENNNISRQHAKFKQDIDGVWIEDLGSKNGVWVNGQEITEPVLLKDSDQITLGDIKFSFSDSNAAMLKRLSVLPAFLEPEPAVAHQATEETPKAPSGPPPVPPSPVPDYIFIGLMSLVALGLIIGSLMWTNNP